MEKLKIWMHKHFESVLILGITLAILVTNYFVVQKMAFLNFYYLPVLVAGYFLGRKQAIFTAVFVIAFVIFLALLEPVAFMGTAGNLRLTFNFMIWGGFLILAASVVGTLYEQKEKKVQELKQAYIGVVEILSKYLEASDRYTKGHSVRVADYATEIAIAMELPRSEVENIRVAGLLHDIGKIEISSDLIKKAATLTQEEKKRVDEHTEKGAVLLNSVGTVLKEAIPIVLSHHNYFTLDKDKHGKDHGNIPLGARIIAVADAFDAMLTDRPYRKGIPPWQAVEELEKCAGTQFDPGVVQIFKKVIGEKVEVV
ncbi:MAG: HD domain-containing phosphohydrolase [Candidatus Zixiibacteriota bacterium]